MRNLAANPAVELAGLVDTDNKVGDWLAGHYPEVPFTTNTTMEQLDKWDARAVVLATPAGTHPAIAKLKIEDCKWKGAV